MGVDMYFMEKNALDEMEREKDAFINEALSTTPFPPDKIKIIESRKTKEFYKMVAEFKENNPEFYPLAFKTIIRHPFEEVEAFRLHVGIFCYDGGF